MDESMINDEFYENILKHCLNVKTLSFVRSTRLKDRQTVIGTRNEWLLRQYSTIENFELADLNRLQLNELKTFFVQNPHIRTFSTNMDREFFEASNLKLDTFAISINSPKSIFTIFWQNYRNMVFMNACTCMFFLWINKSLICYSL